MKNRLATLRAEKGWTQEDLAVRCKVSRQTVNSLENGRYDPSLRLAFTIAKVFQLSIEDIFNQEETND